MNDVKREKNIEIDGETYAVSAKATEDVFGKITLSIVFIIYCPNYQFK